MKEAFRSRIGLSKANVKNLDIVNDIIEEYRAQGYKLTLRQLYYQLVSRDIIDNKVSEYGKLSNLLVKGRMAGIVDWDAIEDRIRRPQLPYYAEDVADALNDIINQYRIDRMEDQDNYIEVWVEKDALSGVLRRVTEEFHIRLMVNRGYSSATAMYDAYKRFKLADNWGKSGHILYLGDHDPSGLDMVRDITERLDEFGVNPVVSQIALTTAQVKKFNPPPNPAKVTDPRAKQYIAQFGKVSWEVDALKPGVLNKMLESAIWKLVDKDVFQQRLARESEDVATLNDFRESLG